MLFRTLLLSLALAACASTMPKPAPFVWTGSNPAVIPLDVPFMLQPDFLFDKAEKNFGKPAKQVSYNGNVYYVYVAANRQVDGVGVPVKYFIIVKGQKSAVVQVSKSEVFYGQLNNKGLLPSDDLIAILELFHGVPSPEQEYSGWISY